MPSFPAVFELSSIDGTNGFRIDGVAPSDQTGYSVASAGDVNGDGYDDLIIGVRAADPNGENSGASYVVFGGPAAFGAKLDLGSLDGGNGFKISGGGVPYQLIGKAVASAGDVNGDGYDDVLIGANGAGYVVFGHARGFAADLNLNGLNGGNGFRMINGGDQAGRSLASVGDFNGDGFDDIVIGAFRASLNGPQSGGSYIVFGSDQGFLADLDLSDLDGSDGFRIRGAAAGDYSGYSVASAGDLNSDGFDDVIIGAREATGPGAAYVIFGAPGGFGTDFDLTTLNGANGFRMVGLTENDKTGVSVASAGDVNGDGRLDLIVGAYGADPNGEHSGSSYVVFGPAGGFDANLDLSTLNGANGFRIDGVLGNDASGRSVSSAGDINGDGFGDVIVGAANADPNGSQSGASYVVFGAAGGFTAVLELSSLNGEDGFRIDGVRSPDLSGWSVARAGDLNNDGIDDLIIGAWNASPNFVTTGAAYVIYGQAVPAPVIETGTAGDDTYTGASLDDALSGLGGNDVLSGLGGDDELSGGDQGDLLYGGDGADDLFGDGGGDILYGEAGRDSLHGGDDGDKLFGGLDDDGLFGGAGNDRLDGGDGADTLLAGTGNDSLNGGAGADFMAGEQGNDVYIVESLGDLTIESGGEGYDVVRAGISWTLAANIEALQLQGVPNINGTGNADANNLQGNAGDNRLSGLGGVDTINGGDGDDIIIGGTGGDLMRGGTGADVFVVAHASAGALETDQVYDFSTAEGDSVDLSGIDAIAGGTDDAFVLVAAFGKHAGEMTLSFAGGITTLKLDVTGDGRADYQMRINGDVTADSGGWML